MELLSLEMISQYGKQTQEKALEAIGYLQRSPNEFCTVWRKGNSEVRFFQKTSWWYEITIWEQK